MTSTPSYLKNDFTKIITDSSLQATEAVKGRKGYKLGKQNRHLFTPGEEYIQSVFDIYTRLLNTIDQLNYIPAFLSRLPSKTHLETNAITELNYVQYHLEVYVHKMHTVLEIMRLLVNEVYAFGLKEKDCSWENLRKFPGMNNSQAGKILNSYFKSFKDIIDIRHYNSHRGIFKDSAMEELGLHVLIYSFARKFKMDITPYNELYPEFLLKHNLKKLRTRRRKDIMQRNKSVEIYMDQLCTALLPEFNSKLTNFGS
jgi:hypothetical protein